MKDLTLDNPATYRICIRGDLDQISSNYLQGMTISAGLDEGRRPVTTLTGQLMDQAALLGVLNTLYSYYQLPLLSVEFIAVDDIP